MEFQKYVCVVNGASKDDMPSSYGSVYVINRMPRNDWPSPYDNVCILNGMSRSSDSWPSHYENIYVVNFDDLMETPGVRKAFNPSLVFLKCNMCWTEFEASGTSSRFYACPNCGNVFHEIQSLPG